MRRWWIGPILAVTVLTTAAGCAVPPAAGNNSLTDGWASMPTPRVFTPRTGTCHATAAGLVGHRADYAPVRCDLPHEVETVFVGIFTGAHGVSDRAPSPGSATRRLARANCDQQVKKFLGDDWPAGRVRLEVIVPSTQAWSGGARWYRCDIGETVSMQDRTFVPRTTSLAGTLAADGALRYGCFTPDSVTGSNVGQLLPVACARSHQSEFAGLYHEPSLSYDDLAANADLVHERCRQVVADYAKLPVDDDLRHRFGTIYDYPFKDEWDDGHLTVRCLLWRADPPLTGSVRDGGPTALPIHYD
ncbi:septum formation family protein [Micromonospora sp. LOL_023]|uniref:septum formation family protein n=1 Tax=Micromonospora sp. LOL_023 TaxID=3345418 RepID=UPI003A8C3B5A